MNRVSLGVLFFILTLCFVAGAQVAKFKGFVQDPDAKVQEMNETITRFEETPKEFLIVVRQHAALFSFPKKTPYEEDVRGFLKSSVKSKRKVHLTVDIKTSQIHMLSTP